MALSGFSLEMSYQNLPIEGDIFIYTLFRMANFFQSLLICTVFLLALYTIMKEFKLIKSKAILIESIGLILLNLYGFSYLIRDLFLYEAYYELLTSLALIFSLIGLILIISNFIIHPDYLYLLPFPIFSFMIFNEGGTLCYFRKVQQIDSDEPEAHSEHLLAGAFTAVSNMFKEVLGAGANIRYIDAENFIIIVTSLPENKGVLVVISRGDTALFKSSIIRFANTWTPQMLDEINKIADLNEIRPKIDKLIKSAFPYVEFS
jgi:signal transduction histidine kinase